MPVSDEKLEQIRNASKDDSELQELQKHVQQGWPDSPKDVPAMIRTGNIETRSPQLMDLMLKSQKIIIQKALRQEMLGRIHIGHMGVQKSLIFNKNIQTR